MRLPLVKFACCVLNAICSTSIEQKKLSYEFCASPFRKGFYICSLYGIHLNRYAVRRCIIAVS